MAGELMPGNPGEFLIHRTGDGRTRVEVRVEHGTVWLTQKQMADLFQKDVSTVSEQIGNIFEEAELQPDSVIRNLRIAAADAGTVSHETARLKAEAELVRFRATWDASPQPVDRHFAAAIEELKQMEGQAKRKFGRKKKGGDA